MKICLAALLVLLPIFSEVCAISVPRLYVRQNVKDNNKDKKTADAGKQTGKTELADGVKDPQKSHCLLDNQIGKSLKLTGQEGGPVAGQIDGLRSENNFINGCADQPAPLTDGKQSDNPTCNPIPMGTLAGVANFPSCVFTSPGHNEVIAANKPFTVRMQIRNLETGNFINPDKKYFGQPQTLGADGSIKGHSHVTIEKLDDLQQKKPLDARKFAFFKGLNDKAQNGELTTDVGKGLPAGDYRVCSINSSAGHQPVLVSKAQHGSTDDCVRFSVQAGGGDNGKTQGKNDPNGGGKQGGKKGK